MAKIDESNYEAKFNTAYNALLVAIREKNIDRQEAHLLHSAAMTLCTRFVSATDKWFNMQRSNQHTNATFTRKDNYSLTPTDFELCEKLCLAMEDCALVIAEPLNTLVVNRIYKTAQSLPGASSPKLTALSYALFAFAAVALVLGILGVVFTAGASLALGGVVAAKLSVLATALSMSPVAAIGTVAATGVGVGLVGGGVTTFFNQKTGLAQAVEKLAGPKPEEPSGYTNTDDDLHMDIV